MCFAGSIRDVILMKNFDLLSIIAALFAVMTIYNIATGNFHLSFSGQPIAHSQHLWNILGMYVVGFAAVLAGGCPLRQLILAGQGSSDSAVTFLGMLLGAAFAHNFNLVGSAAKAATATDAAVPGGPAMPGKIAVIVCIVLKSNRPKKFCYNKIVPSVQTRISLSGYLRGGNLLFYQSFVVHRPCRLQ